MTSVPKIPIRYNKTGKPYYLVSDILGITHESYWQLLKQNKI